MRRKTKLPKAAPAPKPAYVMADPNDDAAAFGWTLGKLRFVGKADKKGEDPWPGPPVFQVPVPYEVRQLYGHDIEFVSPAFVQLMLDSEPAVRKGAERARAAGYTKEALAKFQKIIDRVFVEKIMPAMQEQFQAISLMVAEFYAARLAHIDKFGADD